MKKIVSFLLLFPLICRAELIQFQSNNTIKASEVNANFNYVKSLLTQRNIPVEFRSFQSGVLVNSSEFETEFNKVRYYDVNISSISSQKITSQELNNSFTQMVAGSATARAWPMGADGDLVLDNGSYRLDRNGNSLQVINTTTSTVVKSNIGTYISSGDASGTCQVDFNLINISATAILNLDDECKWLLIGVKNDATINGQFNANSLTAAGSWSTRIPNHLGDLTGDVLSYNIVQRQGAKGASGTASSSVATFGAGGDQVCGYGGGGGGGAGVNYFNRENFGYTATYRPVTVPARVTQMRFKLWGGGGAGDNYTGYNNGYGGGGGSITGTINTTPGEILNVVVGGGGSINNTSAAYGSGGLGAISNHLGYRSNAGGLTGIFKGQNSYSQATALAIAGGGGSASSRDGWSGGAGGNPGGHAINYNRGFGATNSGPGCSEGRVGSGGQAGCGSGMTGANGAGGDNGGGAGGGGYFGGGGGSGGTGVAGGGGGGGLSYYNATYVLANYLNGSGRTPGNTGDSEYGLTGNAGYGGTSTAGYHGYAMVMVEGTQGANGTNANCGSAGPGGLGSVNNGGVGGQGGAPGSHGQGIFLKIEGNLIGTGSINVNGKSGINGAAGIIGGSSNGVTFGNGGQGGGGAGGSAGKIIVRHRGTKSAMLQFTATKGLPGLGGSGAQDGEMGVVDIQTF